MFVVLSGEGLTQDAPMNHDDYKKELSRYCPLFILKQNPDSVITAEKIVKDDDIIFVYLKRDQKASYFSISEMYLLIDKDANFEIVPQGDNFKENELIGRLLDLLKNEKRDQEYKQKNLVNEIEMPKVGYKSTIEFKNGQVMVGKIVEIKSDGIVFDPDGGLFSNPEPVFIEASALKFVNGQTIFSDKELTEKTQQQNSAGTGSDANAENAIVIYPDGFDDRPVINPFKIGFELGRGPLLARDAQYNAGVMYYGREDDVDGIIINGQIAYYFSQNFGLSFDYSLFKSHNALFNSNLIYEQNNQYAIYDTGDEHISIAFFGPGFCFRGSVSDHTILWADMSAGIIKYKIIWTLNEKEIISDKNLPGTRFSSGFDYMFNDVIALSGSVSMVLGRFDEINYKETDIELGKTFSASFQSISMGLRFYLHE